MSLEEIRKKKLEDLQERLAQQQNQEFQEQIRLQQQIEQIESLAKQYLSKEALLRYGNLKSAHPEKAIQIATIIVQLVQSNQIREKISDEKFKELLKYLQKPKKETKIRRV